MISFKKKYIFIILVDLYASYSRFLFGTRIQINVSNDTDPTGSGSETLYISFFSVSISVSTYLSRLRAAGGLETADQENMEHIRENIPSAGQQTNTSSGYSSGTPPPPYDLKKAFDTTAYAIILIVNLVPARKERFGPGLWPCKAL